jgi:hypothetical protein
MFFQETTYASYANFSLIAANAASLAASFASSF